MEYDPTFLVNNLIQYSLLGRQMQVSLTCIYIITFIELSLKRHFTMLKTFVSELLWFESLSHHVLASMKVGLGITIMGRFDWDLGYAAEFAADARLNSNVLTRACAANSAA